MVLKQAVEVAVHGQRAVRSKCLKRVVVRNTADIGVPLPSVTEVGDVTQTSIAQTDVVDDFCGVFALIHIVNVLGKIRQTFVLLVCKGVIKRTAQTRIGIEHAQRVFRMAKLVKIFRQIHFVACVGIDEETACRRSGHNRFAFVPTP